MRIILAAFLAVFGATMALAETRAAFVVGNGAYDNAPALANPARDARLVGDTLRQLGFSVDRHEDLTRDGFSKALGSFLREHRDADLTVFYFAGHGMQYEGANYLVGTDAALASELDIEAETIALDRVAGLIEKHSKAALIFIDACRDNPLATDFYRVNFSETRALATRGLARVSSRFEGAMTMFAAAPGQVAFDGTGTNSPFAAALARHLPTEGAEVLSLTKRIIGDVREATEGRQSPIVTNDLTREIYLREAAFRPPQSDAGATFEKEKAVYAAALRTSTLRGWAQYFDQYPNGQMRSQAAEKEAFVFRRELKSLVDYRMRGASLERIRQEMQRAAPRLFDMDRTDLIAVQAILSRLGHDPGALDGALGPKSFAALESFQTSAGLTADGVLDRATLAALGLRPRGGTEASRYVYSSIQAKTHRKGDVELLETDPRVVALQKYFGLSAVIFGEFEGNLYAAIHAGWQWNKRFESLNERAEAAGGHLATITSRTENDFIFEMIRHDSRFWGVNRDWTWGPTIGLFQKPNSTEPRGGWTWVTGEPMNLLNWDADMPNNNEGTAAIGAFGHPNRIGAEWWQTVRRLGTWDDYNGVHSSFIIEMPG